MTRDGPGREVCATPDAYAAVELRLLLEEVCTDLCRFEHTIAAGIRSDAINIDREAHLGPPGTFADIRIQPHGHPARFVEVNFGYSNDALLKSLKRKYHTPTAVTKAANGVVLVVDESGRPDYADLIAQARASLHAGLELEVWNEVRLREGYLDAAYETARAICSIGKSVTSQWQRRIDRLQPAHGVHVGMALGELELLSLRPYSRTHIGFVGDGLNVAARLMGQASCDEIVVSNSCYARIHPRWQPEFSETEPIDAKNVGRIAGWRSKVVV